MDTEQSSDSDIVSRMAAVADPVETEKPETPAPVVESQEPETPAEEVSAEPDTFDFTDDDGEVIKLPKKIEARVQRWDEHVRTKQETTALRKQAEDRLNYVKAYEQMSNEVAADVRQLQQQQYELQQLQGLNWSTLDAQQALGVQQRAMQLQNLIQQGQHTIQGKAAALQQASKQHASNQWQQAETGAVARIGRVTKEDNEAMGRQVAALGFDPGEFKERFADPRVIHAVFKAAKYDALMAGKAASVQKTLPTLKPGASQGQNAFKEQRYSEARARLKKTGNVNDAAALFRMRG